MQRGNRRQATISVARAVSAVLWAATSALAPLTLFAADAATEKKGDDVTALSDLEVTDDPLRALSNEPSASSFGFAKPLLETPRSVSFISEEQIRLFGISTVEDLTRVVPGTFTTTRYGLQGGVQVRGVPSDYYYRGMKRLNQQGHARTVLSAMDNIEVVKGPPSPLFGMGKIGGYVNLDPKSSRARSGKYLTGTSGFFQGVVGTYDRGEMSFGAGGPFTVGGRPAGYYVYGLLENSNSYVEQVEIKQRFIQATTSIDNAIGPFRLEFGGQGQQSVTSGAYMNRGTQDLYDNGTYITGMPLANMDLDGDGAIGFLERNRASPALGNLSVTNQALVQRYRWPTDASGNFLPLGQWPVVAGVPQTMLNYLNSGGARCSAAQYVAGLPAGGPVPLSGQLPVGLFLDPCTTGTTEVNWRRNGAYESEQNAKQMLLYMDLVYDTNPDFTVKNQVFFDLLDSFKDSYLPYGEKQDMHVFEEKFTVTKKVPSEWLPNWLQINSLGSINYRRTKGSIHSSGADFDLRQDVMFRDGRLTPNTSFWTWLNNNSYSSGNLQTTNRHSTFDEKGVGALFDIDIARTTNLLVGARYDDSRAKASDAPLFFETAGTSANPGLFCPCSNTLSTRGTDSGVSWSASLSHQLPWLGLRPYATLANSALTLDGSNNVIAPTVISGASGHIGEAELKEVGIKSSMFNNKLQVTVAAYEQTRTDVSAPTDPSLGAEVSSSEYRGIEAEIKWQPTRDFYTSAYVLLQSGRYTVAQDNLVVDIDARTAGFQDIVDASGNVIYPAEAFFYGGRVNVALPAALVKERYMDRFGNPGTQAGMSTTYQVGGGFGLLLNTTYQSATWGDRLKRYRMPDAVVFNAGVTYDKDKWHLKLNGYNVTDERYYRAAAFESVSGLMFSVMPGKRVELTAKIDF